jgi:hypothetical protein
MGGAELISQLHIDARQAQTSLPTPAASRLSGLRCCQE